MISCFFIIAAKSFAMMPNDKVLKSFETIFNNARNVKWYDHADYYEVSFVRAGIKTNVKFDTGGNFLRSTRYYTEQQLPANILCKIKSKYKDKRIFGVTELTTSDEINYHIKLEDDKNWITINIDGNGQIELLEKYKKA